MADLDPSSLFNDFQTGFGSIVDRVETAFGGTTPEDVADGSVKLSQLSREERASLAIDKKIPGTFDASNPWHVGHDFGFDVTAESHAEGGVAFVISVDAPVIDVIESKALPLRYAFLWDDEVIAEQGTISLDFVGKTFLIVRVADVITGGRLTLWSTDSSIVFTVVKQGPPSQIDQFRTEVIGAVGAASGDPLAQIQGIFTSFFDVQKTGLIALAVVALIAGYVIVKTDGAVLSHLE